MATSTQTRKPGSKIAKREAYGLDGKTVTDLKDAIGITYTHDSGAELDYDLSKEREALIAAVGEQKALRAIAYAVVGFKTVAGNAINSVYGKTDKTTGIRPLKDPAYGPREAMRDFENDVHNGNEWTNREGGNEIGSEQVIAAIAELHGKAIEGVRAYWHGGEYTSPEGKITKFAPLDKDAKSNWRKDDQIKSIMNRQRQAILDAKAAEARKASGSTAPSLGF